MGKMVKVAVLSDCALGKAGDVVEMDSDAAVAHAAAGNVDTSAVAVRYREAENAKAAPESGKA